MRSTPIGIAVSACRLGGMSVVLTSEELAKQLARLADELTEPRHAGLWGCRGLADPRDHLLGFEDEVERCVEPRERDHIVEQVSIRSHSQ
jgi:hypothetical protein